MNIDRHNFRSATYIFLYKDEKVLLTRRFNTGYKDGQYSTVSGHLEPNESIIECALRELYEEVGVKAKAKDLLLFHVMVRDSGYTYIDFFFKCIKWEGEPIIGEPNRCDDIRWFLLDQLPLNTIDYIRKVLILIKNKISFSKYG